ncbi:MAG: carbamoyl phosphate synthase large subunit, partial [Chloroflexota bacterium]
PGVDARLGPEMRSTGEVMGHAASFGHAFIKAQIAAGMTLPTSGTALISVNDFDKGAVAKIARDLHALGFRLVATAGTAQWLEMIGLPVERVNKVAEGSPHVVDRMLDGAIDLVINTPLGGQAHEAGGLIRGTAHLLGIPIITTMSAAVASVQGIKSLREKPLAVRSLQAHHRISSGDADPVPG